ncbi:histone [Theileria orientalis]|uniref:Histone n=1 Tax=Theileria orientalis TaxID=68886 RepID=A0A976M7N3_THEOR|nr:histone [Theileria orientalis]
MGVIKPAIINIYFTELIMGDRSPDIESDSEETRSFQEHDGSNETSITPNADQFANFHVNLPASNYLTPSDYDDDFANFRVEFGRGVPGDSSPPQSTPMASVVELSSELSEDEEEQVVYLEIRDGLENVIRSGTQTDSQNREAEREVSETREAQDPEEMPIEEEDDSEFQDVNTVREQVEGKLLEEKPAGDEQEENPPSKEQPEKEEEEVEMASEPEERPETEAREVSRTESLDKVSMITTDRSSLMGEGGSVSSKGNVVSKEVEEPRPRIIRGRPEKELEKLATRRDRTREGEKRPMPTSGGAHSAKRKYLTPAAVISQYAKGNLTNSEAMDAIMKFRVNKMLPKRVDGVYMDKEEIRIPKGYSFAKHRKSKSKKGRIGLTRIEREIRAYQESTQMLIPRSIFARIVREIAQGWFKGEGQIKFTVEALSALQVATEDEIIRLLEISTACSYHAKRITLRVDDMRLARFCRGRQNYEFTNIN